MHKVTNVSVLSNIVRLGTTDATRAYSTLRRWRRIQNVTKRVLQQRSTHDVRWSGDEALPTQAGDRLFMSFHYGLWYMSLAAMAKATGCHRVYCLVGEIHPSYNYRMAAMARAAGIEIVLVPGGIAMLRGVRKARAEGALIFVLVDVPWGLSGEPDQRFPFFGGHIEAKSALFTFAERAGLQPHLLVADYDEAERSTFVRSHPVQSQAECFELLQRYVAHKPWLWERLIDIHKFSTLAGERPHLPFKVANDFYVADMANLKVSRVNRRFYERMLEAKRLVSQGFAAEAASLLEQIHASTTLAVRSVF
jgi:hypothetical protein